MKITDLLHKETINLNVIANSKKDVLQQAVGLMNKSGNINDIIKYEQAVFKREEESTTGIGEEIAIPHAKSEAVSKATLAAMIIPDGVDYDALDGEKVKLLFLIAAPVSKDNIHLDVLARLSMLLMDEKFKNNLLQAKTKEDFLKVISDAENEKLEEKKEDNDSYDVLAVTACPTGIAHTYMAQEALEKTAKEMNVKIKVETNGSSGIKNALTSDDINKAKGIIVAADTKVEMSRFNGKKVVIVRVAKAIHEPKQLIEQAINEDAPIYKDSTTSEINEGSKDSKLHTTYKHLMNGVSHMLPFVIGGGLLIALAFLIDSIAGSPQGPNFGSVNPVAAFFNQTGSYAFKFMLPVLAGYIAYSIADRPGLVAGFVGGYMATLSDFSVIASKDGSSAGFLGALLAGFIAGYLVVGLKKLAAYLPNSLDGIKPTLIYPLFGVLGIGIIMYFVINAPFAYVNSLISGGLSSLGNTNKVILGFIVAAMMAIDMGGPINKAAYVFGVAAISSGNYDIMAAVMIGGMIPPLAIALSTTLFPQKYTKKERSDGKVNYIMGLSFITEGAIPFAASDPLRVIISSVVGAGVAGGLSMAFGCTLMAPHGGIFVVAVIGKWYYYLLSIVIGTVIATILLGLLKKDVKNPELGKFKGIRFKKGA